MCPECNGTGLNPETRRSGPVGVCEQCIGHWRDLSKMAHAFCEAVLFGESEIPDDAEFSDDALVTIRNACAEFLSGEIDAIDADGQTPEQFGHDFYMTSVGHGVGFWDGDWPIHGERLTEKCRPYHFDFYVGDDGLVYVL